LPLETCETMNNSWGYNMVDRNYKPSKKLIQFLVQAATMNANLLLNVGPMPNGVIQPEFTDTLQKIGQWMQQNSKTIYGTRGGLIPPKPWGGITQNGKTMYVHLLNKPDTKAFVFIEGFTQKIIKAIEFANNKKLTFKQVPEGLFVYLNGIEWNEIDTIIELVVE